MLCHLHVAVKKILNIFGACPLFLFHAPDISRRCFGCCAKSQPIIAVDEPSKGLRIQGQEVKKPSISEDFWSTSTCDMDNSQVHSQRSVSSISLSNQSLNLYSGTGSTSNCTEFVNHGLLRWNQTRLLWNGSTKSQSKGKVPEPVLKIREYA
ncbi:uncharacterized protein LOC111372392 [Olea europaea var. sylvestris]|uniref:uncharacterized protein LOC111372392 n=1 Tax=Olea europaea var. sylvestris TaxID=158386 RepID=UPI000C1D354A|nr:uncharacterized protein LOC111372392 [Olea europaea var. sylvestris]